MDLTGNTAPPAFDDASTGRDFGPIPTLLAKDTIIMLQFAKTWLELKTDKRAVTALEYAVLAGIIVVAVGVGFATLGSGILTKISSALA